jgi:hypothetical protein
MKWIMGSVSVNKKTFAIVATAFMIAPVFAVGSAKAAVIDWTAWSDSYTSGSPNGSASGTIGGLDVSYSGEVQIVDPNYPSWTPTSSYVGGVVGNAPPQSGGIVQLFGGGQTPAVDTITFSSPVTNPVIAIWSLGQGGDTASFQFLEAPTFQAGGPSAEYGGGAISVLPNGVYGTEGNGTLLFSGTFTTISWTNPTYEDWYGFTVGVEATPLPSTWTMLIAGFLGLGFFAYRGSKKNATAIAAA